MPIVHNFLLKVNNYFLLNKKYLKVYDLLVKINVIN